MIDSLESPESGDGNRSKLMRWIFRVIFVFVRSPGRAVLILGERCWVNYEEPLSQ